MNTSNSPIRDQLQNIVNIAQHTTDQRPLAYIGELRTILDKYAAEEGIHSYHWVCLNYNHEQIQRFLKDALKWYDAVDILVDPFLNTKYLEQQYARTTQ